AGLGMPWHCDCQPAPFRRQAEGALIPSAMPCPPFRTTAAKSPPKALFLGTFKVAWKEGAPPPSASGAFAAHGHFAADSHHGRIEPLLLLHKEPKPCRLPKA